MSKQISDDEFDSILNEIVSEEGACIMSIPGVYEVLSEHFNNEVLRIWEERQEEAEDDNNDEG